MKAPSFELRARLIRAIEATTARLAQEPSFLSRGLIDQAELACARTVESYPTLSEALQYAGLPSGQDEESEARAGEAYGKYLEALFRGPLSRNAHMAVAKIVLKRRAERFEVHKLSPTLKHRAFNPLACKRTAGGEALAEFKQLCAFFPPWASAVKDAGSPTEFSFVFEGFLYRPRPELSA